MKYRILLFAIFLNLCYAFSSTAQNMPDDVCFINNNRIYFRLDKRWSSSEKKEFRQAFNLDSLLVEKALVATSDLEYDSTLWTINQINNTQIEISRPLNSIYSPSVNNDLILRDDLTVPKPAFVIPGLMPSETKYGLNNFNDPDVFKYENNTARFLLKGFDKAESVYLSGSFNNWSTMQQPMVKTMDGWITSISLEPGRYLYKFIIDGKWKSDPANRLYEYDGHSGYNSIVYCYNHVFELKGFTKARKVFVAGSFNNWRRKQIKLQRSADGWILPLYLETGTHFYKYIIDGNWITDPNNKNMKPDANGNENSFFGIGDTVIFNLAGYETANTVILSGNFNNWSWTELRMNKIAGGWELPYVLGPGNYEYKFIVDGKWITDPSNPCHKGSGDFTNSCFTFKPNTTFTLSGFSDAKKVIVTGSFNNWSYEQYQMTNENGAWTYSMYLQPGKYTYKFIVDDSWLIDPANPNWEENELGTGNSVLWVKP